MPQRRPLKVGGEGDESNANSTASLDRVTVPYLSARGNTIVSLTRGVTGYMAERWKRGFLLLPVAATSLPVTLGLVAWVGAHAGDGVTDGNTVHACVAR